MFVTENFYLIQILRMLTVGSTSLFFSRPWIVFPANVSMTNRCLPLTHRTPGFEVCPLLSLWAAPMTKTIAARLSGDNAWPIPIEPSNSVPLYNNQGLLTVEDVVHGLRRLEPRPVSDSPFEQGWEPPVATTEAKPKTGLETQSSSSTREPAASK